MLITPKDSKNIRFTGRWDVQENSAVTTAPGAMIEIMWCGKEAVLQFDLSYSEHPYGHIWIQVDDGAKIEASIDRFIRIEASTWRAHKLTIIYKSAVERQHRWYNPLVGKLCFLGLEAPEAMALPKDERKIIEFIGDSITEGVLIDEENRNELSALEQHNRPYQDDSTATYAYLTANALGMKAHIMGYGAVGVTKSGCGSVPKAAEAYLYNFDGSMASPSGAELIVINHGANDNGRGEENYTREYKKLLQLVRQVNPLAKIVVLSAFYGVYVEALCSMVEAYNAESGDNVYFIDSTGWIPKEPIHPGRQGHKIIAEKLTAMLEGILYEK